jgi:hypothetical protein
MRFNRVAQFAALFLTPAILSSSSAYAAKGALDAVSIKEKIAAHGVGQRVRVTLTDRTEAEGIIASVGDQSFALQARGEDQSRSIEYAQITGVHGDGLSTGATVGIWVTVGVVVLVVALVSIARGEAGLAKQI